MKSTEKHGSSIVAAGSACIWRRASLSLALLAVAAAFLFVVGLESCVESPDLGDDDDDDDYEDPGDGTRDQCFDACDRIMECDYSAVFYHSTRQGCTEDCWDWFDEYPNCAACVVGCWVSGLTCEQGQDCETDCMHGQCQEF